MTGFFHFTDKVKFIKAFYNKKVSVQEDLTMMNIDAPQNRAPKYMKQKLTQRKEDIDISVIIVGNFNTPYSLMGRTAMQKDSKEIGNVSSTVLSYTSRCL